MHSYGGFWIRVLAYIIDTMILQFASSIITLLAVGAIVGSGANEAVMGGSLIGAYGLMLVLNWLYFALLESSAWQGTLGKQALKLVVTDMHGERIGFGRASGRYFGKILSAIPLLIGFLMVGWTARKQGLHDFVAGTLVYKADSPDLPRNSARVFR